MITDPRDLGLPYQPIVEPAQLAIDDMMFMAPVDTAAARAIPLEKTPNISAQSFWDRGDGRRTSTW